MEVSRLFPAVQQFQVKNGALNTDGRLYVYLNGTDDLAECFDEDGSLISQPVILDNNGRAPGLFVDADKVYRLEVQDRYGNLLFTVNSMVPAGGSSGDTLGNSYEVVSIDGSIAVDKSVDAGVTTFDLSIAPSDSYVSNITSSDNSLAIVRNMGAVDIRVNRDGQASALCAFSAVRSSDGQFEFICDPVNYVGDDIIVRNDNIIAKRKWYHYDATVQLSWNGSATNATQDIAITGPANFEHVSFDLSYPHIESLDLSGVLEIQTDGDSIVFAVQGMREDMTAQVTNASVHAIDMGAGGSGGLESVFHDDTLAGDGSLADPLGLANAITTKIDETYSHSQADGNPHNTSIEDIDGLRSELSEIESDVTAIEELIPSETTTSNQLADKAFVNSSISSNTATFRGTSAEGLTEAQFLAWANALTKTNNDYIFWNTTDANGNVIYKRYKYNGTSWVFEYALNNSSFTSVQWAAINSGISENDVENIALNTSARHSHSNKNLLDSYTVADEYLVDAVSKKHWHTNYSVLNNTTASFTTADKTKLDGIEAGANKTVVDSELSLVSANPVRNKAVKEALNDKANTNGSNATGTWGISISGNAATAKCPERASYYLTDDQWHKLVTVQSSLNNSFTHLGIVLNIATSNYGNIREGNNACAVGKLFVFQRRNYSAVIENYSKRKEYVEFSSSEAVQGLTFGYEGAVVNDKLTLRIFVRNVGSLTSVHCFATVENVVCATDDSPSVTLHTTGDLRTEGATMIECTNKAVMLRDV